MDNWNCIWGYESLDFAAFPIILEKHTQRLTLYNFPPAAAFRIRFQNIFGKEPLPVSGAWFSSPEGPSMQEPVSITVNHQSTFAVPPGEVCWSDPIPVQAEGGQKIQITLLFEERCQAFSACTFLENSMTTVTHSGCLEGAFTQKEPAHQCVIGIDRVTVLTPETLCTVAAFGDSITHMSRWTAPLAARMLQEYSGKMVLMNCGICGNRLLHNASTGSGHGGWFGKGGLSRFERDLWSNGFSADRIILLEGINDILHPAVGEAPPEECVSAEEITAGLEKCAKIAHRHHAKIYVCTLMPFNGCKDHWRPWHEEKRCLVNERLRASTAFDGLLDFDLWSRDPFDSTRLDPSGGSEDLLHPGIAGGRTIAEHIDLQAFL